MRPSPVSVSVSVLSLPDVLRRSAAFVLAPDSSCDAFVFDLVTETLLCWGYRGYRCLCCVLLPWLQMLFICPSAPIQERPSRLSLDDVNSAVGFLQTVSDIWSSSDTELNGPIHTLRAAANVLAASFSS